MSRFIAFAAASLLLVSCTSAPRGNRGVAAEPADPYLWLEDIEGRRALDFVAKENAETLRILKADPRYEGLASDVRRIALATDRIPAPAYQGDKLYNLWQDETHVRGLWRRTTLAEYAKPDPRWETVLDLDALAKTENENWVWAGADCLPPSEELCLLSFSRGGKDAKVVREFDTVTKSFVKDGFAVPEAKSIVSWNDRDSIFVGTDFGRGTVSPSGYALVSKLWTRGTPLTAAVEVSRAEPDDTMGYSHRTHRPDESYVFHTRYVSSDDKKTWIELDGRRRLVPMPKDANFQAVHAKHLVYKLASDLKVGPRTFVTGSLVALPIGRIPQGEAALQSLSLVFAPTKKTFLSGVSQTRNALLLDVLDNIKGRILKVTYGGGRWKTEPLALTGNGMAAVYSVDSNSDDYLAAYTDFLTPTTLYAANALATNRGFRALKSAPARFDASGMTSEQLEAVSADGTKIPYFVVHKKGLKLDGTNPTLLYGYGGFEVTMTPSYLSTTGKAWLERGGVYVLANIRGGGEFGPAWHRATQRENHQRAFDDFIAVAENLIQRKITSPRHLGIQGGSNGGLLTGATFVQRPDLFNAVLVEVPLLDMLRYHKLLAGASWISEYGNPDDPAMREIILKYSPYQNVKKDAKYPEVFILTSTKDDRVHPGHARKMAARMREDGHALFYYENVEGGHGGAANIEQKVQWSALEFTYLWRKLGAEDAGATGRETDQK